MNYGFALVGLGFGKLILKDFFVGGKAAPFFQLRAVCDANENLVKSVADEFGVRFTKQIDDLLLDDSIHVIGLFTGPVGRGALIRKIVAAGRHVMTTKPFESDLTEVEVLDFARARGCVILMNSPQPVECREDLSVIRRWASTLGLGAPITAHSEVWASYREKADGTWKDDPNQCPAAPIFRLSIYAINDLIALFGRVESVNILTARRFTERQTPDNASAILRFENGMLVSLTASFCVDDTEPYQSSMILHFEKGTIYRNMMRAIRGCNPQGVSLNLIYSGAGERRIIQEDVSVASGDYPWETLHESISKRSLSAMPDTDLVAEGLRVIDAIRRAEQSGRTEFLSR